MKVIVLSFFITAIASQALAAKIISGHLDQSKQILVLDVSFGDGCGQNSFSLELQSCSKSSPMECTADLVQESNDNCESLIHQTVVLNLKSQIGTTLLKGTKLTIIGDQDWRAKRASSAVIEIE